MHKATIAVVDPDKVEMRLTIQASVGTLRNVEKAITQIQGETWDYCTNEFLQAVQEAIERVDQKFVGLGSEPPK